MRRRGPALHEGPQLRALRGRRPPLAVRQFSLYATIGTFTTSLDAGLFALLVATLGWDRGAPAVAASVMSYAVASTISYVLNSRITFRGVHRGDSLGTISRFAITLAASSALGAAVFATVQWVTPTTSAWLAVAKGTAILAVILWNFTLLRGWVFRPGPDRP